MRKIVHLAHKHTDHFDRIAIFYVLFVGGMIVYYQAPVTASSLLAGVILAAIGLRKVHFRGKALLSIALFLAGYGYIRDLLPILTDRVHIFPMVQVDSLVFGTLPTLTLQSLLYSAQTIQWYDYLFMFVYATHYAAPLVVAYILWRRSSELASEFALCFLLLSYLTFITYAAFPAMPPWMASNLGHIPQVTKIMNEIFASFSLSIFDVYAKAGVNLIAAVPSMHAANPWLMYLFLRRTGKKRSRIFLLYVFTMWFAVVYLGEHYVVDVALGIAYATGVYFFLTHLAPISKAKTPKTPTK